MAAGDRSNTSVVGAAAGPPGAQDEVFLAAHEAAQAQRDSQGKLTRKSKRVDDNPTAMDAGNNDVKIKAEVKV